MNHQPAVVRAVVVDDEPAAREAVVTLLAEYPQVQVVGQATNGRDAVEVVRRRKPDLLFLDIQMPDQDGFEVLTALGSEVPRGVVFVTAHDEHALRAFEVHALDFLLKPFGRPRFSRAVARALERLDALDALTLQHTLASMARDRTADTGRSIEGLPPEPDLEAVPRPLRRIGVRTGAKVVLVDVEAIDWLESLGDYARIHTGRSSHVVAQSMQALERALGPVEFLRIHRSLIVRLKRIRELHRESDGGGMIVLDNGIRLRVARGRWEALQSALQLEAG